MQFFDRREAREPERFTRDNDRKCQRGGDGKSKSEKAEALASCEQILDQLGNAKSETEQGQPTDRSPEYSAPAKAPLHGHDRRLDRYRQQRGISFRRDVDRAAGRSARIVRIHYDDGGIVELEGRRPAMMRSLAHCSLSPIRNWRARSRRM